MKNHGEQRRTVKRDGTEGKLGRG